MWKNRAKVVLPRRVASEPAKNLGNYCPVKVTVSLSWCTFLLVAVFLLAFILCALLSVVQVTYLTTSWMVPACLHGSNYYWLSGAYCLLFSLYAMKRLCYLGRLGPTKLCRLGGVMFISAFIEYLIFTEIIYSTLTVESITEYRFEVLCTGILSLIRLASALLTFALLRSTLSGIPWDVGDPIN